MEAETRYTQSGDGTHIAYQVTGDGPIDVLELPNGTTISFDSSEDEPHWARYEARIASFCRLIRFDCRGVGLSDPFVPSAPPSLEDWMQDAIAVLDAAGSAQAALLGVSTGGEVAMLLAATRPERVSALVVVHGFARVIEAPDYPAGFSTAFADAFTSEVVKPAHDDDSFDDIALLAPSLRDDPEFRRWWKRAGNRGASPALARALFIPVVEGDIRAVLPTIQAPTLVLQRRHTKFMPASFGRYVAEHIPGARYVELGGDDHLPYAGDQDEILDEVQEFLTGVRHQPDATRVLSTVVFTDIVGSTEMAATLGDDRWAELLERHDRAIESTLRSYDGRLVKTTGDGSVATFDGPARAIRCALAIRSRLHDLGLSVRTGLHTGEIELRGDDIAGIAVHLAARVSAAAGAGEVFVSRTVTDLVAGSGIEFEDRGERELKGVPGRWGLFAVVG